MQELIVNLSEPREQNMLVGLLRGLRGMHRITIKLFRPKRSDPQNNAYFGMIVEPFAEWLMEKHGEARPNIEKAHAILKDANLRTHVVDENGEVMTNLSGDPLMRTMSTTELDTDGFSKYFDDCRALLAELCGIDVPDPDPEYARR